ncbi:MAG: TetR/AcrR family transcriptional regulator [Polyangiaceae bacterium]|nr:TetR/AcrR family transcriptional regulator [Polyangiaceae bacterium]
MPRRPARTKQGRAIVDSILEAAERVVAQAGSVNAIRMNVLARLAGVSVGSVYHYFPNRQAIIAELARRLEGRGLELAGAAIGSVGQGSTLEAVRAMVKLLGSSQLGDRAMRRSLLRDVPASWIEEESKAVDETVQGALIELLRGRPDEIDGDELPLKTFIIYHAVESVIERTLMQQPELFESDIFWDQLTELTWRFLRKPE